MTRFVWIALLLLLAPVSFAAGNKVTVDDQGVIQVNGKPFFPLGIWVYDVNPTVVQECVERRFNTIVGNGFGPDAMDGIHGLGMMAIPFSTKDFLEKSINHPALLMWYLTDEPEGHNMDPAALKKEYDRVKAIDPNHPLGVDMYLFEAIAKYKDAADYTMTDVYPVTKNRDVPLKNVGVHIDEARRVHGANWPHLSFIQTFGGEKTDGGKWAQPTPAEVRCMTFIALVHRANGILDFSYWPQAPETWQSIGQLNRDLYRIVPWLIAPGGKEMPAKSSDAAIEMRARKIANSCLIIAVNTERKWHPGVALNVESLADQPLRMAYENREIKPSAGKWIESFAPMEEKVYLVGAEPEVSTAK
jgi:hypothetical protein